MSELRPAAESGAAEYRDEFVRRHVGTSDDEQSAMLKVLGYETLDALIDAAVPDSVRSLGELRLPPAASEREVLDELRQLASSNVRHRADDGPGLLRHDHAGRDQAERAREPGLVHRLHPVPTRDQPGPPRSALEFPDHGVRSHRARYGERLAARRGHRRGRGSHAHAAPRHGRGAPCHRGRRLPAADHRDTRDTPRAARDPRSTSATSERGCPKASSSDWSSSTRDAPVPCATLPCSPKRRTSGAPWSPWRRTSWL